MLADFLDCFKFNIAIIIKELRIISLREVFIMKKILVIKLGALGDFIHATGVMKAIKNNHPNTQIDILTSSPYAEMSKQSGFFDNVYIDNRPSYWNLCALYKTTKKTIADGQYSKIYDLQESKRTLRRYRPLANLFSGKYLNWITFAQEKKFKQEESDLSFLRGPGKNFDLLPEKFILLIPGCSARNAHKRWSPKNYSKIAQKAAELGIYSVALGTLAEKAELDEIGNASPFVINFCNKSALLDIPQIVSKSLAVIGNDTGPTQMASLCNKFTIGLFAQKHQQAKLKGNNVANFVGNDVNDISVEDVWNCLKNHLI